MNLCSQAGRLNAFSLAQKYDDRHVAGSLVTAALQHSPEDIP